MTQDEERRVRVLEKLLVLLMKNDHYKAGRELKVCVDFDNQAIVEFALPPTQAEIDALIEHLKLMKKQRPETRDHVSLASVNAALREIGVSGIENTQAG